MLSGRAVSPRIRRRRAHENDADNIMTTSIFHVLMMPCYFRRLIFGMILRGHSAIADEASGAFHKLPPLFHSLQLHRRLFLMIHDAWPPCLDEPIQIIRLAGRGVMCK